MRVEVTEDRENSCWNYRIYYPGGGSLGGSGYASELWAWRAAAQHLASLVGAQQAAGRRAVRPAAGGGGGERPQGTNGVACPERP